MSDSMWHGFSTDLRCGKKIDWDLFTVLEVDWTAGMERRSYSSDEVNYPSGGVKALMQSEWAAHVISGQRSFVARNQAMFRWAFFDFELLESMGLRFALNIPVAHQGRTVRTINILRSSPSFADRERTQVQAALVELASGK